MKYLTTFAFVTSLAGLAAMAACSSGSDSGSAGGAGSGNSSSAGAPAGGAATAGAPAGGAATAGAPAGGAATAGAAGAGTAGSAGAGAGAGGASAGAGGASGGAGGASAGAGGASAGAGGASGSGGASNAVVATCGAQTYTKTATPGGACATSAIPTVALISTFDDGTAAGWGAYPNGAGAFTAGTPTPVAGGANGTAKALTFTVNQAKGIRIEAGFGTCQDVRTFQGLSFWAKGTVDAALSPPNDYAVDANTLVITLGAEKSAQGGCTGTCSNAPDRRVTISADWKEYRVPFNCFGDAMTFDGYFKDILFNAFGTMSSFSIDQVGYY